MREVQEQLARIPQLAGVALQDCRIERLAGLTNRNYKLRIGGNAYVLRIPGDGTGEYIDRRAEEHNARVAAAAGVNAPVFYFDAASGVQLAGFIDDAATMNGERFRDLGAVARAARAFRTMHDCGTAFASRFDLFGMMDGYLDLLRRKDAWIPDGYGHVQREALAVREALELHPAPLRPCHCDPLAENFLDTGQRMFIVDWEYAGNNDPMWDLADLSVEAGFGAEQDAALMGAYFGAAAPADQQGRMVMYKAMCDLLWTLWGAIQLANRNPTDDYRAYAENRFARCRELMATAVFDDHLAAVRAGAR